MDSLRKWFYRPKKGDTSLLAQFFYADEALNMIAHELDSFDGRKDPERCTSLVNQLRQSQDKVLTITNSIMDVLIGDERANRDFRVKFPEDVLQENLAGQLWFGAECLAAGSSIMNREFESAAMRPLAKALTKSLEKVRNLLREACLRNNTPNGPLKLNNNELVTEKLLESLKIFDMLFAQFELCYVSAMVPVKTTLEYELQELIGVLFSETLQRALKMKLLTQEMVDDCDPALMFTIPRLAIVSGLVVFPNGPLCVDKPVEAMSEMFRPFRTLLLKIRELLLTLNKCELYTLEKLLCDNEQSGVVLTEYKLSEEFVAEFYRDYPAGGKDFVSANSAEEDVEKIEAVVEVKSEVPKSDNVEIPSTSGYLISNTVDHDSIVASIPNKHEVIVKVESLPDHDSLQVICDAAATLSSILSTKEGDAEDCSASDERKIELNSADDSGICTENTSLDRSPVAEVVGCQCSQSPPPTRACRCIHAKRPEGTNRHHSPSTSKSSKKVSRRVVKGAEEDTSSVSSTDTTSSFSSECADEEEIAMAMQAAELATRNEVRAKFRSSEDLIHRLYVCIAGVADQLQTNFASDLRNILKSVFLMNASDSSPPPPPTPPDPPLQPSIEYNPTANEVIENEFSVDPNILAQEALFDSNVYFQQNNDHTASDEGLEDGLNSAESVTQRPTVEPERPPIWIPDVEAPKCMSCKANFTVVKRRHHCRNCGKVFCSSCSSNSVPLPKFGHVKPVRVCNKCFMYHLAPFTM